MLPGSYKVYFAGEQAAPGLFAAMVYMVLCLGCFLDFRAQYNGWLYGGALLLANSIGSNRRERAP
jgi:hypothetical protein